MRIIVTTFSWPIDILSLQAHLAFIRAQNSELHHLIGFLLESEQLKHLHLGKMVNLSPWRYWRTNSNIQKLEVDVILTSANIMPPDAPLDPFYIKTQEMRIYIGHMSSSSREDPRGLPCLARLGAIENNGISIQARNLQLGKHASNPLVKDTALKCFS